MGAFFPTPNNKGAAIVKPWQSAKDHPAYLRAWGFFIFCVYSVWIAGLLLLLFGVNANVSASDTRLVPWLALGVAPLFAAVFSVWALRQTTPPATQRHGLTAAQVGLVGYGAAATVGLLIGVQVLATPTDLYRLLAPVMIVFWGTNVIMILGWRHRWRANPIWLLLAGSLTVAAVGVGAWFPADLERTVQGVTVRITSPQGRVLPALGCRPLAWQVDNAEGEITFGVQGGTTYRTISQAEMIACAPLNPQSTPQDPTYLLHIPLPDGTRHTVAITYNVITIPDALALFGASLLMIVLPPLVLQRHLQRRP